MISLTIVWPSFSGTHSRESSATSSVETPLALQHNPVAAGKHMLDDQSQRSVVSTLEMPM